MHLLLQRLQLLLGDEHAELAGFLEIEHGDEEGGAADACVAAPLHPGKGGGEQRAAEAIADRVDGVLPGCALDRVQRVEDALAHVIVETGTGQLRVGVDPRHHEQRMPLTHRPAHETVVRAQIEDVELVDPGRDHQQRALEHGLGGGRVLDQLHQPVLVHHLARAGRDVAAQLERFRVGHLDAEPAAPALQIAEQVVQAAQQVLAPGLDGAAQHLGVGEHEIARAHRIDELARVEIHLLLGRRFEPVHVLHHVLADSAPRAGRIA